MQERSIFERVTTWVGSPSSFILHTLAFILAFVIGILGLASWEIVLLVLTTVVSLEAIYLSIFIQMTVNRQAAELAEVSEDVEDIQEDIEEISEDVDEIQEDIDEIQEDGEEINEEGGGEAAASAEPAARGRQQEATLEQLAADARRLLADLEALARK
jgi:biopolymer transport protein ExbB/TolQ